MVAYSPVSCDVTVDVGNVTISDLPDPKVESWACACVVQGGVNISPVRILTLADPDTGAITGTFYYLVADDNTLSVLDPALVPDVGACIGEECVEGFTDIETVSLCDDVNGDGSVSVSYVSAVKQSIDSAGVLTTSVLGTFSDATLANPYNPNNPLPCCDFVKENVAVYSAARREDVTGPRFYTPAPSLLAQSLTVVVKAGPVTVTDSNGVVSQLAAGEVNTWEGATNNILSDLPSFDVPTGSNISVLWTEPVTQ